MENYLFVDFIESPYNQKWMENHFSDLDFYSLSIIELFFKDISQKDVCDGFHFFSSSFQLSWNSSSIQFE
jgi:hypothetical protein